MMTMGDKKLKYTKPNLDVLDAAFTPFPQLESFVYWYETEEGKKPTSAKTPMNDPSKHKSFIEAITQDPDSPLGLAFNDLHPLIAFDIDGVDQSQPHANNLKTFIEAHPSYEEASPSGQLNRRRRIYALMNKDDKQLFQNQAKHKYPDNTEVALYVNTGYTTLTGHESNLLPIALISPEDIFNHFPIYKRKRKDTNLITFPSAYSGGGLSHHVQAALTKPEDWVNQVPLDQDDPRVQKFMAEQGINFYDYWIMGLMVLHYSQSTTLGLAYALSWSEKDPLFETYAPNCVEDKWHTLTADDQYGKLTERTYQWMFNYFNIPWPVKTTKGGPMANEYSNFDALLEYYDIMINVDAITKTVYLTGPDAVLYPRFYKDKLESFYIHDSDLSRLAAKFIPLTRIHKFMPDYNKIKEFMAVKANEKVATELRARFAQEVKNTPRDSTTDYIKLVARDILQRDSKFEHPTQEFHENLVRKWLLSIGRTLWPDEMPEKYRGQTAEGMLILSGKAGGIGKSTFSSKLFPPEWKHLTCSVKPRLSGQNQDKDYKMITCTRLVVDFDEGERVLNSNAESDLKSELTQSEDLLRVPYGHDVMTYPRMHSFIVSTNDTTLTIPREGARRYWWTNVKFVDLTAMDGLDMYHLWAEVRHQLITCDQSSASAPWILTDDERKYLESYISPHRAENQWEKLLLETYDFSPDGYKDMQEIIAEGNFKTDSNNPLVKVVTKGLIDTARELGLDGTPPGLDRALKYLIGKYAPSTVKASRTLILDGVYEFRGQKRYLLPIRR